MKKGTNSSISAPPVMTSAMPRPATSMPSVATMGCTRATATTVPLNAPTSTPATTANSIATPIEAPSPPSPGASTKRASTALAIAMMAPTERSTPPVPITSAMPSDTMITGGSWANSSWIVARVRKLKVKRAL